MRTIDNMKMWLDSPMINRIYERLITKPGNRLCERLIKMPYLRLSGLADNKTVGCMAGQTISHSNIKTVKRSNTQTAECNYDLACSPSVGLSKV